jgi:selenocysteine lyase/cysteine desulfurase
MLNGIREREFSRLDREDHAYLDYTGSALYGESQLRAHHSLLAANLFGNPHSESGPSLASSDVMNEARELVLDFFDVDSSTHDVCFTANTTAAIKLVAESYPFGPERSLVLSVDNHNSINGIREFARRANAPIAYLPLDRDLRLRQPIEWPSGPGLLAFPAQSNFSGVRHPLSLVAGARRRGFDVILDVAAFVPSQRMSLREVEADFVALSFYKLFGYPTGLGALVARRDSLARLRRPWFSGGTVMYASVEADTHRLRPQHEAFEDGTPDFLGIAALPAGFALLDQVESAQLSAHVAELTAMFLGELRSLRHDNGAPLARIYGPPDMCSRGGAVAFNVCDRRGEVVAYSIVEDAARRAGVSMRGGCFCNPGASEVAFGLDRERISGCFDSIGETFTVERFASCVDSAVGAVRVSVGMANNRADVLRALDVVRRVAVSGETAAP